MKTAEEILKCARYYPFTRGRSNALLCASASGCDYDDVVQEYALRCLEQPDEFESNPYWTAIYTARKIRKLGFTLNPDGTAKNARYPQPAGELGAVVFDRSETPEQALSYKELRAKVEKFIDDFWTPKTESFKYAHFKRNRMITRLCVLEGWTQVELSERFGMLPQKINEIIMRCIEPMRVALSKCDTRTKANKAYYARFYSYGISIKSGGKRL